MSEAPRTSTGRTEKPSTDLEAVGRALFAKTYTRLGTTDDGRHLDYDADRGEIKVRKLDGVSHVTVESIDLDGSTLREYRHWVETQVDETSVDWNDAAFDEGDEDTQEGQ